MTTLARVALATLLAISLGGAAEEPGWTVWKGDAARTGVAANTSPPPMQLLWRFSTEDNKLRYSSPIVAGNRVFFCSQRKVYCLDDETGEKLWEYELGHPQRGTPAYYGGLLFVGNGDGFLYAINVETGTPVWQFPAESGIHCSPLLTDGQAIFGAMNAFLYCITLPTAADQPSKVVWQTKLPRAITGSPATDGRYVYVVCGDMYLYALNRTEGSIRWKKRVGLATSPTAAGNLVLAGAGETLYALRTNTGSEQWRARLAGLGSVSTSPVVKDNVVYFGTKSGRVLALDLRRGRLLWKVELNERLESTPTVADNCLWLGSSQGFVFCLSLKDGSLLWKYRIHDFMHAEEKAARKPGESRVNTYYNVFGSPVVVGDRLYVQGDDGTLYRFGAGVMDEYGPELKTAEVHVPSMDDRRLVRVSLDPKEGEDPVVVINGQPPIRLSAKMIDEGSGLDESSFKVTVNGKEVPFRWDPNTSRLLVELASLPTQRGVAMQNMADGQYQVDLTAKDWAGNEQTHTKWLIVNNSTPRPRLEKREGGGEGMTGAGGGRNDDGGGADDYDY